MIVQSIGNSLMVILPDLVGKRITNWFDLVRPLIAFKFQTVNIFIGVSNKQFKRLKKIINVCEIDFESNEQYF